MLKKFVFKKISTIKIPKSSELHRYVNKVQERNTLSTITIGHIDVYQLYITMYQPLPYNQMPPFQCAVN